MFGGKIEPPPKKRMVPQRFFPASFKGCVRRATGSFAPGFRFCPPGASAWLCLRDLVASRLFPGMFVFATYFPEKCCGREDYFAIRIVTQIPQ
jgi:hypothetical protein